MMRNEQVCEWINMALEDIRRKSADFTKIQFYIISIGFLNLYKILEMKLNLGKIS